MTTCDWYEMASLDVSSPYADRSIFAMWTQVLTVRMNGRLRH